MMSEHVEMQLCRNVRDIFGNPAVTVHQRVRVRKDMTEAYTCVNLPDGYFWRLMATPSGESEGEQGEGEGGDCACA